MNNAPAPPVHRDTHVDGPALNRALSAYRQPQAGRSIAEILVTALPFVGVFVLAAMAWNHGQLWSLLLILPAAGLLVRLFIIQHDCGHGSFFRQSWANDWVGRVIGVITLTPYDVWRRTHAAHHASCGNLEQRGMGDVVTLTVEEYLARSQWGRLRYRIYRHPLALFGFGPLLLFFFVYRIPIGLLRQGWRPWFSAMVTNAAIVGVAVTLIAAFGLGAYLIYLATMLLAASIGVWLFYVQHQFGETLWLDGKDWSFHEAALHGSSHYDLPMILKWFSGNIGIHHIHHLSSRIPFYRLPKVLHEQPQFAEVGRLTLWQSLRCVRLVLWDSGSRQLISFAQLRASRTLAASTAA